MKQTKTESAGETQFGTRHKLRFVTAASLFDGHDASINIMRRVLQQEGAEVIHLGHNRSVEEIVEAAIEEDAQGIAVSSYQGGHLEYFHFMVDLLRKRGAGHIRVFGGGGGTITDEESRELEADGVEKIYSVEDGRLLGLLGMIRDMMTRADFSTTDDLDTIPEGLFARDSLALARSITLLEKSKPGEYRDFLSGRLGSPAPLVLGITGTGGAGKSSLTDELVRRFLHHFPEREFAILSVDPSSRRTGGALLGDRIRMNAVHGPRTFMHSMATRRAHASTSVVVEDALLALRAAGFDLVILETAGIGQSDSQVADLCDLSLYVMTPEFGAPSQLEKIEMLDFARGVVINKADKRGAEDALRDVRKQVQRNRDLFEMPLDSMPVFLTAANHFGNEGVDRLFEWTLKQLEAAEEREWKAGKMPERATDVPSVVPGSRVRYLSEISEAVRSHHKESGSQAELAFRADGLARALREWGEEPPPVDQDYKPEALLVGKPEIQLLKQRYQELLSELDPGFRKQLAEWESRKDALKQDESSYEVRGKEIRVENYRESLSGTKIPKVALPSTRDWGELLQWFARENLPGSYPYTAGVFPFKRTAEDPTRQFAGEGIAERTNRRFHYLSRGLPAVRLSTAFDSVTLYGEDPNERPDIYGKVGNSGVSICSLDDVKRLYSGFDLCSPKTSVSMTINGPAPMMLAFYLNAAVDQAVEKRLKESGRWDEEKISSLCEGKQPQYRGDIPEGHDGSLLGMLGVSGEDLLPEEEYREIRDQVFANIRGTVQADILKEDQAQNTCIFSAEFALKMMGDVQEFFVENGVRNFYSVSISGYHIAEAGANPISQLAFTLANGFTYVEYYRARGMEIDRFAPNLSFFFSNGMDAEYSVIGRVARRIWAIAMRDLYGGNERSQKLKYHIQTSGRSLHAQEIQFNDIRTTLQALYAINDNAQSLHTNAYDEAITTPTEESVRRALAIQLIINREFGLAKNENPEQGAFIIDELTDAVEGAVLREFDAMTDRGGVLGSMETMYQRGKIQEESLHYETLKHSGELPIVGVNTFQNPETEEGRVEETEMIRSTEEEKQGQVEQVRNLSKLHGDRSGAALLRLREAALSGSNIFEALMDAARVCTIGQMSRALYDIGGQYRRGM
ncbi:MAG: methylmalonyl-CoA mutase family protein [Candidatus Krumholzibacteria bacterium]|jgi:methylmalonyl-CoA mutase|nr:methylmalonyl-CoA mutase family protein [Candidatus Krumholzibacteria bacterium]MDP6668422.1 methylmalonyl-CoA mutase family protein [Candidatus Krumholzibacteria bacterium]MDP6797991.1 methylmalonyl-CoA mutase family protein [Candidatus Krumholzibacteria bacterium]MDP7021854.1 methylmalonyl-CoA mutase family protein [Candidatus Krumholzibacteria bacterium]